jgi:hypothetical protein
LAVLLPPLIVIPPQNLTVTNGSTANFSVVASGSAPLSFQWKLNGTELAGATTSSLAITNAQASNQGDYTVVVSNSVGSVSSAAGHLTVQTASTGPFQFANWQVANGILSFDVSSPSQTNVVLWSSTDLSHWTALSTNFSSTGTVHFSESSGSGQVEFYRATLSP